MMFIELNGYMYSLDTIDYVGEETLYFKTTDEFGNSGEIKVTPEQRDAIRTLLVDSGKMLSVDDMVMMGESKKAQKKELADAIAAVVAVGGMQVFSNPAPEDNGTGNAA